MRNHKKGYCYWPYCRQKAMTGGKCAKHYFEQNDLYEAKSREHKQNFRKLPADFVKRTLARNAVLREFMAPFFERPPERPS